MKTPRTPPEVDGFEALGKMCVLGLSVLGIGVIAEWFNQQTAPTMTQNTQTQAQQQHTPPAPKQPTPPQAENVEQTEKKSGGAFPYVPLEIRTDR